jgi:hypothetical protein
LTHIRDHAATKNVSRKIGPRQATKPGREQLQNERLGVSRKLLTTDLRKRIFFESWQKRELHRSIAMRSSDNDIYGRDILRKSLNPL